MITLFISFVFTRVLSVLLSFLRLFACECKADVAENGMEMKVEMEVKMKLEMEVKMKVEMEVKVEMVK